MKKHKFNIYPEAEGDDFQFIVADMRANGYDERQPIYLYEGAILDGWNRYRASQKAGVEPVTKTFEGTDSEAIAFMARTNKRRNLNSWQKATIAAEAEELLASIAEAAKAKQLATLKQNADDTVTQKFVERPEDNRSEKETSHQAASMFGTNRTYLNDAKKLKQESPEQFEAAKRGELSYTDYKKSRNTENHRAIGTGENEWYTPPKYIEAAREVLGTIDLDPASSEEAQESVRAGAYFTKKDDGLSKAWAGSVWMNPPYAQPYIMQFVEKLCDEYAAGNITQAIVLTHNYTDTRWFHLAAMHCSAICFTRGRIGFLDPNGKKAAPTQGQAFFYFGDDPDEFASRFKMFGFVFSTTAPHADI